MNSVEKPEEQKIKGEKLRMYGFYVILCILLEIVFIVLTYHAIEKQLKTEAKAHAEEVTAAIQSEIHKCYETTELLEDLYKVYGSLFLKDFHKISAELTKDNLVIGSMYFAPKGIIKYSFPNTVDSATSGFDMLKDPIQGPKAQMAVDDRKTTIAGPHKLVEGGTGFIIRNPLFKDDQFEAFSIIVLDKKYLMQNISKRTRKHSYNYAVWKEPDPTALLDQNGYIFSSRDDGKPVSKDVENSFEMLNDTWHLSLEPIGGWNVWKAMKFHLIVSIFLTITLLLLFYMHVLAVSRKRMLLLQIYANNAKSKFLFNMSHDIRTPMNAIIGFTDLMKKNLDDPEKVNSYLKKIKSSSNFLLTLINNVLEMARIENGQETLAENIISTQYFEDETDAFFSDMANEKGVHFSNIYKLSHDFVVGDETKIREITLNIVSNAIKYTPPGGFVKLFLDESESKRPGYTLFTAIAEDSGIGISKEYLPHIFEEFSRERNSTDSRVAGTGLGMAIVKKLLDLMHGTIEIQSELHKGTKITIQIELRIATEEEVKAAMHDHFKSTKAKMNVIQPPLLTPQESFTEAMSPDEIEQFLKGKRILLAEDNDLNAEITTTILEEKGFKTVRATDGLKCVNIIDQYIEGYFDLILMDIQMPRMDGYEATKIIRAMKSKSKASIPIIAMTANAFEEDRKKAFEVGMNGHIAKPFDVVKLIKVIGTVLH